MKHEVVVVLDFGGQYSHLIARRIRECGVYCEVMPHTVSLERLIEKHPKGIVLTGGPNSVYDPKSPTYTSELFQSGVPTLGICYGAQLTAYLLGGKVDHTPKSEFGGVSLKVTHSDCPLFSGVPFSSVCWMSHNDYISQLPHGFTVAAVTDTCPAAAIENREKKLYAVQFHPEVAHSQYGQLILKNFLTLVCGCRCDWQMSGYVSTTIQQLREKIGSRRVLCAMSGGVDSTVAAVMIHKAVGNQLTCMFVDHGLLRKEEGNLVEAMCKDHFHMNFLRINAQDRFFNRLSGVEAPEEKRKIIGEEFIRVFEEEGRKLGKMDFLVQGTIYPDIIESGLGDSAVIKSHHNVGGLPDVIDFDEIIEPLRLLFKDEVRRAGLELGIPEELVWRQPFPGPGLAVRIIGAITKEKVAILQEADAIFREEITKADLQLQINQYFAVLTNMRSVGVMGDGRTYDYTIALRGVTTVDFMTADFARIPYDTLATVSNRIVNEVKGVNRVVYDITSKPPATIEWE